MANLSFTPEQIEGAIRHGIRGGRQRYELESTETIQKNATHESNLAHYRIVANECLNERDYLQAAEKSWGAYAQTIKGISAAHGISVSTHSNLVSVAQQLNALAASADVPAGAQLRHEIHLANSRHQHFYENHLLDDDVERSVSEVMDAIELLPTLFDRNRS